MSSNVKISFIAKLFCRLRKWQRSPYVGQLYFFANFGSECLRAEKENCNSHKLTSLPTQFLCHSQCHIQSSSSESSRTLKTTCQRTIEDDLTNKPFVHLLQHLVNLDMIFDAFRFLIDIRTKYKLFVSPTTCLIR